MSEYTELIERLCDLAAEIEDYEDSSLVCEAINAINELSRPTNADRIRSMTDEELAEWLCDIAGWLPMYEGKMHPILDWLKQEVTE